MWEPLSFDPARRVLRVGADEVFKKPSEAARAARNGNAVLIEDGEYVGDTAVWDQSELLIRGVGGRPRLVSQGVLAEQKAIWVIKGSDVTVENFEFVSASVPDRSGAGIRAEGKSLTVRNAFFRYNETGILTANDPEASLVVEFGEFADNGAGDGYSHNLYVGKIMRFEMRYSSSSGARSGHLVKSRAAENLIEYNRLVDGENGTASFELEFPSGGNALVVGNLIVQSASAENSTRS